MRIIKFIPFVFSLFFLNGCIFDDSSDCPIPTGFSHSFFYYGDGSNDIFQEKIKNVDIYIFDKEGHFLINKRLHQKELEAFQGINLDLPAGKYFTIYWANAANNTYISSLNGEENVSEYRLFASDSEGKQRVSSLDPLYFASYPVYIEKGIQEGFIEFLSAHITLDIYVEGFAERVNTREAPIIKIKNAFSGYDFFMNTFSEEMDYFPEIRTDNTGKVHQGTSCLPRFQNDNNIQVDILSSDGKLFHTLCLKEFINKYQLKIENIQEAVISIYVKFTPAGVNISIAEWDEVENVKPSF